MFKAHFFFFKFLISPNNFQKGGFSSITPSARPSIHSHARGPFSGKIMGRYGLTQKAAEGRDEVDNVTR